MELISAILSFFSEPENLKYISGWFVAVLLVIFSYLKDKRDTATRVKISSHREERDEGLFDRTIEALLSSSNALVSIKERMEEAESQRKEMLDVLRDIKNKKEDK